MAKKTPSTPPKAWKPGDPLRFDQAIRKYEQDNPVADPLEKADTPLYSQQGNVNHPLKPANHKSHIRQKKV